ncbi:MAG: phosphoribosylformylglycinamidine cyclo-ligase [Patescibacteria group bacterium]
MTRYEDAGVNISRGDEAVERLKKHVVSTYTKNVLAGVGAYAGALDVSSFKNMKEPTLLATIDGVGTKTLVAERMGKWDGIGEDIVNHCANDLVCQGAAPLLFLDYVASSRLNPSTIEEIVAGMSRACKALGCVLIGGETAEMPQVYAEGSHDVVGAMIGVADRDSMITGNDIQKGDVLIALPSNGLHTNGYSLARKVLLDDAKLDITKHFPELGCSLAEALLKPHTEYSRLVRKLHDSIGLKGVAHITGSGIPGNLPRILPEGLGAKIEKNAIKVLPIFQLIQKQGAVPDEDMFATLNMGVGMLLVLDPLNKETALREAQGSYLLGEVTQGEGVEIV